MYHRISSTQTYSNQGSLIQIIYGPADDKWLPIAVATAAVAIIIAALKKNFHVCDADWME